MNVENEHAPDDGMRVLELLSDYEDLFRAVVKERLQMAGVRLGKMLNDLFSAD